MRSDIIDVFSAFLLLSYGKLMYQSVLLADCPQLIKAESGRLHYGNVDATDFANICRSGRHLMLAIPAGIVITLCSWPVLLLTLYPVKPFRRFMSKLKHDSPAVNTFVDKFHSCYKDGTNGGRDLRSFSGLYFILRVATCMYPYVEKYLSMWSFEALLFTVAALLIAFMKPYKEMYMNVLDILILIPLIVLCMILSSGYSTVQGIEVLIVSLLPAVGFGVHIAFKVIYKVWKRIKLYYLQKKQLEMTRKEVEDKTESEQSSEPLHTVLHLPSYGTV